VIPLLLFISLASAHSSSTSAVEVTLCPGFVKRLECNGRIKFFSIGDPTLVEAVAPPSPLGCVLYLRALRPKGHTNLELETSVTRSSVQLRLSDHLDPERCSEVRRLGR
jgi:hypothetical protein